MSRWIIEPDGLIEPVPAPEIRCNRIGAIQVLDGDEFCVHLVRDQLLIEDMNAPPQAIVVGHIIGPAVGIPEAISYLAQCLWLPRRLAQPPPRHNGNGSRWRPRAVK